jgi:hypothetical protein
MSNNEQSFNLNPRHTSMYRREAFVLEHLYLWQMLVLHKRKVEDSHTHE